MKYQINFGYENVIVPMNAQTTAAIEVLFGKGVQYKESWVDREEALVAEPREFRIKVLSDDEFNRRLAAGHKAAAEGQI